MKVVRYIPKKLPVDNEKPHLDFSCLTEHVDELNEAILKRVKENEIKQRKSQIIASQIYSD